MGPLFFIGTAGRIELPLPDHNGDVAFGGFPTREHFSDSHSVYYPICVATHGDATGRLFNVQNFQRALIIRDVNNVKSYRYNIGIIEKVDISPKIGTYNFVDVKIEKLQY